MINDTSVCKLNMVKFIVLITLQKSNYIFITIVTIVCKGITKSLQTLSCGNEYERWI